MWIDIMPRKPRVHLRYESIDLKEATQRGTPQGRPNMEPRDTHRKNSLVRKLTNPRNLLVEKLVRIPRREGRRGNIPRVMTLKSSRNPNHPLLMDKLRRGKNQKFGCVGAAFL
jgi:hypothetical protein